MKEQILNNLDNPGQLEKLYRGNKSSFRREFDLLYPEIREVAVARVWHERLNFESDEISWGVRGELTLVLVLSFLAGLVAKFPDIFTIDPEHFYQRNIPFIVFPFLSVYFAWKQKVGTKAMLVVLAAVLISLFYINFLPRDARSDTLVLACMHLPLLLWATLGYTFVSGEIGNYPRRLDFLRYNGDLVVMTAIILLAGGLLSAITVGLFQVIDISIEEYYFKYIGIWGLSAAPIAATYLVQTNPQLVSRVSPVIAKVFTPLVLPMLLVYLFAVIYTGKDPYNDREFLLIFNILLLGVMAIILFSVAESSRRAGKRFTLVLLLALSVVTIAVNGIALSAILFRISEWGITPNRMAVLGSNILILANLVWVAIRLFQALKYKRNMEYIANGIAFFLPVYSLWTALVVFVFPLVFGFR